MLKIIGKVRGKLENEKYVLASFGICALIMLAGYAYMGIYPFGGNSVLKIDMYHQYAPFYEELRNIILNGESFFYSWGGLGKNFLAQFAYYTSSPLNLLLIFAEQEAVPQLIGYLIVLKVGFCGLFFAHYLKRRFGKDGLQIVVFAVFYALSAYTTAFYWNIMWLDVIALFPMVALGIRRIIDNGGYRTYLFSLAACIIMNFYLAFIVCIFSAVYFLISIFCKYRIKNIKSCLKPIAVFSACSLLAAGISMALLLPTYYAITKTSVFASAFPQSVHVNFNIFDYLPAHFWGVTPRVMVKNESLPNVYCGILTIMLLPFYYINKKPFPKTSSIIEYAAALPSYYNEKRAAFREKMLTLIFLSVIFIGFYINIADFIFHGFHFPACLPHRFSFIYIFAIISISYKAFLDIEHISINKFIICAVIFAFYIFINDKFIMFPEENAIFNNIALAINFILLTTYAFLFVLFKFKAINKNVFTGFLLLAVTAEFSMSAMSNLPHKGYTAIDNYTGYMADVTETTEYLDSIDDGFYRMEFFRFQTTNDSSLFHYRGMTQFSSTANGSTTKLLERIGVSATANSCRYYDPTQLINAMFSIKYILFRDEAAHENVNEKVDLNFIKKSGGLSVYENEYCLPLGYAVNKEVLNWETELKNPFLVQNDFIEKAAGITNKMYEPIRASGVTMKYADISERDEGIYYYKLQREKSLTLVPEFKTVFKNPSDQYVYLYIDSPNSLMVTVQAGNIISNRDFSAGRGTIDIGYIKANSDISVSFKLDRRGDDETRYKPDGTIKVFAAGYDSSVFKKAYSVLNTNTLNVSGFTASSVKGSVTMNSEGILLTSIPYDDGWQIYVNGERTDSIEFQNNAFIALSLNEGTYDIEMRFVPKGFRTGITITVISIIIIFSSGIFKRINIHKRAKQKRQAETAI